MIRPVAAVVEHSASYLDFRACRADIRGRRDAHTGAFGFFSLTRETRMKIGILGSGEVAKALGAGFLKHEHSVMLGTRDAGKLTEWAAKNVGATVGSFSDAASYGELVVLAVKGTVALEALELAGDRALAGKTVIDATNPLAPSPPEKGVLKFFTNLDGSLMERLQAAHPKAHFVKAFNSVGSSRMVNPVYAGGRPTMFICGNDAASKAAVSSVVEQFGWDPFDMGAAEAARAIEPLCILWCIPGFLRNEWTHAFKLLHA
jgi:predicted dinucleotide-binding enzyme